MGRIFLVPCSKKKWCKPMAAKELYHRSPTFKKERQLVERHLGKFPGDSWWILSDYYGLLSPERVIPYYERSLKDLGTCCQRVWRGDVLEQMHQAWASSPPDEVVFFAGNTYRGLLEGGIEEHFTKDIKFPLEELHRTKQREWLKMAVEDAGYRVCPGYKWCDPTGFERPSK